MTFFYDLNKRLADLTARQDLTEGKKAKPDFLDVDKDGNKKETFKKAVADKQKELDEAAVLEEIDQLAEKWAGDTELNPKKKGMFKGKTKAELQSELAKLKKSGPHEKGSAAYTKMKELQFAIRAKSGWGKVDEEAAGTDFQAVKASNKVKLRKDRGVEPGHDLDEADVTGLGDSKRAKVKVEGMKVGDRRPSSTGGTIEKTSRGIRHIGKSLSNDELDAEPKSAPSSVKRGRGRPTGSATPTKSYDFPSDEKAVAAHKRQPKGKTHKMDEHGGGVPMPKGSHWQDMKASKRSWQKMKEEEQELDEKSVTQKQARTMAAAAHDPKFAKKVGIKGSVAKEFNKADKGTKLLSKAMKNKPKREVEECGTVAGGVATAYPSDVPTVGAASSQTKPGIEIGKGVYEELNKTLENLIKLNESLDVKTSVAEHAADGDAEQITITATGADVGMLRDLLKNAGLNIDGLGAEQACSGCGCTPCECSSEEVVAGPEEIAFEIQEEYGDVEPTENKPNWPTEDGVSDDALQYSGGLDGPKSTGQTTVPVIASQLKRQATMEDKSSVDSFLSLFKVFKNK